MSGKSVCLISCTPTTAQDMKRRDTRCSACCTAPWLPIDLLFGSRKETKTRNLRTCAQQWVERMRGAYQITANNSQKSSAKGKRQYDRGVRGVTLQSGDRGLVKNLSVRRGSRETVGPLRESSPSCGGKSGRWPDPLALRQEAGRS